uniref:Uncharacterized protein n=1 Tax=Virgibacillus oceani TaxID=1479511 RepID=A0A917HGE7_9BACI|nr:hypothetical protein GCM10011398_24970 [Virgibacillus oceani]
MGEWIKVVTFENGDLRDPNVIKQIIDNLSQENFHSIRVCLINNLKIFLIELTVSKTKRKKLKNGVSYHFYALSTLRFNTA